MTSLNDVKEKVDAEGGVATFSMAAIRDAYGAGRLGIHVRANISKALNGLGLAHYPRALPDSQYERIRVYKLGSSVADLIDAVLSPGDAGDDQIRSAVTGDAEEVLAQVRELVCA